MRSAGSSARTRGYGLFRSGRKLSEIHDRPVVARDQLRHEQPCIRLRKLLTGNRAHHTEKTVFAQGLGGSPSVWSVARHPTKHLRGPSARLTWVSRTYLTPTRDSPTVSAGSLDDGYE